MGQYVLLLVVALTVGAVVFGVTVLLSGSDPGLGVAEPDGRAVPLPGNRPLTEPDIAEVRFDTALRGYRMAQVDQALRRAAYDIGYKDELISVLEAEVAALRDGRLADAEALRRSREAALAPAEAAAAGRPGQPGQDGQPAEDDGPTGGQSIVVSDGGPVPVAQQAPARVQPPAVSPAPTAPSAPAAPQAPDGPAVAPGTPAARVPADPEAPTGPNPRPERSAPADPVAPKAPAGRVDAQARAAESVAAEKAGTEASAGDAPEGDAPAGTQAGVPGSAAEPAEKAGVERR